MSLDTYQVANNDPNNDFSVKESVRAFDRYIPIDVTLTTTNVIQDLINISTAGPKQAVNLFSNSSFELAATGFTDDGATNTRQATSPTWGTYSMQIDPDNLAAEEGAYHTIKLGGEGYIVVSVSVQDAASAGDDAQIKIQDANGVDLNASAAVTVTTTAQRISTQYKLDPIAADYRVWVGTATQHATDLFFDGLQIEHRQDGQATPYIDPDSDRNTSWAGTADQTRSQRLSPLEVIKGFRLTFSHDTLIAFDQDTDLAAVAVADRERGIYVTALDTWASEWPLDIRERISFVNGAGTDTPRVHGVVWGRSAL